MGAGVLSSAEVISERVILPPLPVPCMVDRFTPSALAMARTAGEANTFPVLGAGVATRCDGACDTAGASTFGFGGGAISFGGVFACGGAVPSMSISINGV